MFRPTLAITRFFTQKICMPHDLYKHSYIIQIFRMKNLMMAYVGRNM